MNQRPPINFEPQKIEAFLAKIENDLNLELQRVEDQKEKKVKRIHRRAYAEAGRLYKQAAKQAQDRRNLERNRYLAEVRANLRRRRWRLLTKCQTHALDLVWIRFLRAWLDPTSQWSWCRLWLSAARDYSNGTTMHIRLGRGARQEVQAQIETAMQDYQGPWQIELDHEMGPGIVIRWDDVLLDGTLRTQCDGVGRMLLRRFADVLHDSVPGRSSR